jgi:hypothetical protein
MKFLLFLTGALLSFSFLLLSAPAMAAPIPGCAFVPMQGGDCSPSYNGIEYYPPNTDDESCGGVSPAGYGCCCTAEAWKIINKPYEEGTAGQQEKKQILPSVFGVPDLKVSIPGLNKFEPATCMPGEDCAIPWLSQYIAGLQRYAVGFVSLLAVIVIMIGGVIWLTAGGNQNKIGDAKKLIGGGIGGVVLTIGAYLLLYTINPDLTILKSINISYIGKVDLETLVLENHDPAFDAANGRPITDTTYDDTFKSFAGCIGIDWRVLKGIAFKESHLDAGIVNSAGFTGLFQTKQKYCVESVRQVGLSSAFCNAGVKDPAVNTAVATGMMKVAAALAALDHPRRPNR